MPTLPWAWLLVVLVNLAGLIGCATAHSNSESFTAVERAAIQKILEEDQRLGAQRNEAPKSVPVADAAHAYVAALERLDLSDTPPKFRDAFRKHTDAWSALADHLERYPNWRGEMHDIFDLLATDSNPDQAEFQRLLDQVWATWSDVESAVDASGLAQ